MSNKSFSIHELPTYQDYIFGVKIGKTITDGDSRQAVIDSAAAYYEERAEEDGEYGPGSAEMIVVCTDDDSGEEVIEEVTVTWYAERDAYDHGRFDYMAGIGAI